MHQQEEPSQISDSAGEGDQNTEGKSSSERDKRTPLPSVQHQID